MLKIHRKAFHITKGEEISLCRHLINSIRFYLRCYLIFASQALKKRLSWPVGVSGLKEELKKNSTLSSDSFVPTAACRWDIRPSALWESRYDLAIPSMHDFITCGHEAFLVRELSTPTRVMRSIPTREMRSTPNRGHVVRFSTVAASN